MTLTMLALLIYGNEVRNYHSKCTLRGDGVDILLPCVYLNGIRKNYMRSNKQHLHIIYSDSERSRFKLSRWFLPPANRAFSQLGLILSLSLSPIHSPRSCVYSGFNFTDVHTTCSLKIYRIMHFISRTSHICILSVILKWNWKMRPRCDTFDTHKDTMPKSNQQWLYLAYHGILCVLFCVCWLFLTSSFIQLKRSTTIWNTVW